MAPRDDDRAGPMAPAGPEIAGTEPPPPTVSGVTADPVPGVLATAAGAARDTVAGPQSTAGVTPREASAVLPAVLDEDQRALLTAVLDRLVPAHAGLAGAGGLGGAAVLERTLAASPALRRLFFEGLLAIDLQSASHGVTAPARGFAASSPDEQDAVLRAVEAILPAFFAALVDHAYRGYYTRPEVHRLIGHASRPPQPLGHHLPPFDPTLLARQRERLPFWRHTP
jgi:hypothetical protein